MTKNMQTANKPKYTENSPETCLPYIPLEQALRAQLPDGIPPNMLGQVMLNNYTLPPAGYVESFKEYQDQHAMGSVRAKLKAGMDEISCDYIDLHEMVIDASRLNRHCLIERNALWTKYDRMLFAHNRKVMQNPPNNWMAQVNLEGNSIVTNCYGLIDFPKELFSKVNGKAVIDGGAFIGDTIPLFRSIFPDSVIYSFEPCENNFKELMYFFELEIANQHVKPLKLGLGNQATTMTLNKVQSETDSRASIKQDYDHTQLTEQVSVITLDEFVKDNHLEVGLLKLDIEGFEPEAVQGSINTLREQKPVLLIAIYHTPEEFYELKGYLESLELGYKFAIRRSSFTKSHTELVLIAY